METVLDRFGRVVLPKMVREALGLVPGTALRVEEADGAVHLRPITDHPPLGEKDGVLVFLGRATGDLDRAVREHRELRLARVRSRR
jgi:AbrB family looped-hinge helix DNA binding protein